MIEALMGLAGGLAGAFGGSQKPKDVSTLTWSQQKVSDELGALLRQSIYGSYNSKGGLKYNIRGATPYEGDFLAPLLPQFGTALNLMQAYSPAYRRAGDNRRLTSLINGKPSYVAKLDPTSTANYFKSAVEAPAYHTWQSKVLPQINEAFAGVGAFSSRQGQATGQALSDMQVGLDSQLGQAQLQNQQMQEQLNAQLSEGAANRSLQAIGTRFDQDYQVSQQPLQAAQQWAQMAQYLQSRQDAGVQAGYQDFLRTTPENSPYAQLIMQYLGEPQKALYEAPNYLANIIGGATGGFATGKSLADLFNKKPTPTV